MFLTFQITPDGPHLVVQHSSFKPSDLETIGKVSHDLAKLFEAGTTLSISVLKPKGEPKEPQTPFESLNSKNNS